MELTELDGDIVQTHELFADTPATINDESRKTGSRRPKGVHRFRIMFRCFRFNFLPEKIPALSTPYKHAVVAREKGRIQNDRHGMIGECDFTRAGVQVIEMFRESLAAATVFPGQLFQRLFTLAVFFIGWLYPCFFLRDCSAPSMFAGDAFAALTFVSLTVFLGLF